MTNGFLPDPLHEETDELLPPFIHGRIAEAVVLRGGKPASPAIGRGTVRGRRRDFARSQFANLVRVEPDEMTTPANIDHRSRRVVGERDFDHGMMTTRTITPRQALAVNRAQPERVDGFVSKSVTQELDAQGATAALRASPKDAALHSHLVERDVATGADEFP